MTNFLIATHGHLADGFKSTIAIIMGEEIAANIQTMNLFIEEEPTGVDPQTQIDLYFQNMKEHDQVIVCTDLMHGSVNQFMIPYANDTSIFVLTGINLPLLCEVIANYSYTDEKVNLDHLQHIVETAQKETLFVNVHMKQKVQELVNDHAFFE